MAARQLCMATLELLLHRSEGLPLVRVVSAPRCAVLECSTAGRGKAWWPDRGWVACTSTACHRPAPCQKLRVPSVTCGHLYMLILTLRSQLAGFTDTRCCTPAGRTPGGLRQARVGILVCLCCPLSGQRLCPIQRLEGPAL